MSPVSLPGTRHLARDLVALRAVVVLASLSCSPTGLLAQKQPVLFVHGLNGYGSAWQPAADSLKKDFPIAPYRPDLNHRAPFAQQATALTAFANTVTGVPLPDTTIAIGHSNGGVVSRTAAMLAPPVGRNFRGIVTLGAPNTGAPLTNTFYNNRLANTFGWLAWYVTTPFIVYRQWNDDFPWVIAYYLAYWLRAIGDHGEEGIAYAIDISGQDQLLHDMNVGSPHFLTLNSRESLAAESTKVAKRVGVTSAVLAPWRGALWWAVAPAAHDDLTMAQEAAAFAFIDTYEYYQFYADYSDVDIYEKRSNAYLWAYAADATIGLNTEWCRLIGAYASATSCLPHDGFMPTATQEYPGNTSRVEITGPAHAQEPSQFRTRAGLSILSDVFGLPKCGALAGSSIAIGVVPANIGVGYSATLTASLFNLCDLVVAGQTIVWTSETPSIATVSTTGAVTGLSAGYATIRATSGNLSATAIVRITATNSPVLSSVRLSGPMQTVRNCPASWVASASGGAPTLSYKWYVAGVLKQQGTSSTFSYTPSVSGSLSLQVTVVDSRGDAKTSTATITVGTTGVCKS